LIVLIIFGTSKSVLAEPLMITISNDMNKVIFDGKWSSPTEWKHSSLNTISYDDGTTIELRTAHQDNFIYIFIDEVSKIRFNKHGDMAVICFDKNNSKIMIANKNDYCFGVPFDGKSPFTLIGGSPLEETSHYMKIQNPNELIGISNVSDENDRYTEIPHASYEFRIPTDLVGRSDMYGFYMGVYDAHSNKVYAWPDNLTVQGPLKIPNPSEWGQIISPDRSLPEFPLPFLALLISMVLLVYFTRKNSFNFG